MIFVPRLEWGARPSKRAPTPWDGYVGVAGHYVGPGLGWPWAHGQCAGIVRSIQATHLANTAEDYNDIAYSLLVCGHGYVFEGRGRGVLQAGNGNTAVNRSHYSICVLIGEGDAFADLAKTAFVDAAEWLGVAGGSWKGHRDFISTSCPGIPIYDWIRAGHPRPGPVIPPPPPPPPTPVPPPTPPVPAADPYQLGGRTALVTLAI